MTKTAEIVALFEKLRERHVISLKKINDNNRKTQDRECHIDAGLMISGAQAAIGKKFYITIAGNVVSEVTSWGINTQDERPLSAREQAWHDKQLASKQEKAVPTLNFIVKDIPKY